MGWLGRLTLAGFACCCALSVWNMYNATSAPTADGHVSQNLTGLSRDELKAIPDVLVNTIEPGALLTFDVVISQYSALPPLEQLKQHVVWYLQEKKALPEEFSLVGSVSQRPYAFEESDDEYMHSDSTLTGIQQKAKLHPIFAFISAAWIRMRIIFRSWRGYLDVSSGNVATLTAGIPAHYRHSNQTLYLHVFVTDADGKELPLRQVRRLTTSLVPEKHKVIKRYLLQDPTGRLLTEKLAGLEVPGPAVQCIPEFVMIGAVVENRPLHLPTIQEKLGVNWPFINSEEKTYVLPPYVSADISPQDEYRPLERSPLDAIQPEVEDEEKMLLINVMYQPVGYAYWYLQQMMAGSFALLESKFGFDTYDMNSLKMTVAAAAKKNSFLVLICIFVFSLAHCFLELMALQADLSFWRKQTDPSGYFSLRTLAYEVITELVVALYLHENDSKLPLFFVLLHILLNSWKITKFVKVSVGWMFPYINVTRRGEADAISAKPLPGPDGVAMPILDDKTRKSAEAFESKCTQSLIYFLVLPMVVGITGYQLVYVPQKGWYSWLVTSAALSCYGFGFVSMTPQLFRNYHLKSVEYMPWRFLFCQFVNTFVDDVAVYVIRMPKMHRMSVFRDDIVFIILMYQRWLYRKRAPTDQAKDLQEAKKNL